MLWSLNEKVNIVSFSDAHSFWPWRLGRESTIFEVDKIIYDEKKLSYKEIMNSIRTGDGLIATIETPPEYGKYHWDGHRLCNFSCSPEKTKELNGVCPVCGKPLIIGVDYRVKQLEDQPRGFKPASAKPYLKLLPLHELIALAYSTKMESKKSWEVYNNLIEKFGTEFEILLNVKKEALLSKKIENKLIELILKNREAKIKIKPGYDGEYGVAQFEEDQKTLV